MSDRPTPPAARVLVVIDTSAPGNAALKAASRLAEEYRAELEGLFVEDINLLHLAGLPFAREVDDSSGSFRRLDPESMEQTLRQTAESVRSAIAETARRSSLQWSFRVCRGNVCRTVLAELVTADLLVIGRENTLPRSSAAPTARGPIVVICDRLHANRTIDTAQRLARQNSDTLVALVTGEGEIADSATAAHYVRRCPANTTALLHAVRQWQPQLLLIDGSNPLVSESMITSLVGLLPCPLALVQ